MIVQFSTQKTPHSGIFTRNYRNAILIFDRRVEKMKKLVLQQCQKTIGKELQNSAVFSFLQDGLFKLDNFSLKKFSLSTDFHKF